MSECSHCNSSGGNTGPQIKIDDLPKGEQIVTTVKREDIPKSPPKCPDPLPWAAIIISVIVTVTLKTYFDFKVHIRPEPDNNFKVEVHPPSPSPHYPTHPPQTIEPSPKLPDYYPPNPQYPTQPPNQNLPETLPPCPQSEVPYCRW